MTGAMATARGPRLVLVAALTTLVVSGWFWLAEIVVPARAGLPFGCGSPAHPNLDGIARQVCATGLDGRRTAAAVSAVLAVALVAVAAVSDRAVRRTGRDVLSAGLASGSVLLAAGVAVLLTPLEVRSADGEAVAACGSALLRTGDAFATGLCADLPDNRLAAAIALGVAALVVGAGQIWARTAPPDAAGSPAGDVANDQDVASAADQP